jgi:hypothetical protein
MDGLEARLQEGLGQQHQYVVGAIAERDLRRAHAEFRGELLLELMAAAVGVQPGVFERAVHGIEGPGAGAERILVGRELDDVREAELALQLFDRFAGHIGRQRTDIVDGQQAGLRVNA